MSKNELMIIELSDLNIKCDSCKYYIANNPIANVYPFDLCTNENNKQSSLSGSQFMQVKQDFACINFDEYLENE